MDNVTHSLTGFALARAGLDRLRPRATPPQPPSANVPHCDILSLSRGQLAYLEAHRGYTHSLLLAPVMALVCVVVTAAVYRERLPWLKAWLVCRMVWAVIFCWTGPIATEFGCHSVFFALVPSGSERPFTTGISGGARLCRYLAAFFAAVSREIGDRRSRAGNCPFRAPILGSVRWRSRNYARSGGRAARIAIFDGDAAGVRCCSAGTFNPFRWTGIVETSGTIARFRLTLSIRWIRKTLPLL